MQSEPPTEFETLTKKSQIIREHSDAADYASDFSWKMLLPLNSDEAINKSIVRSYLKAMNCLYEQMLKEETETSSKMSGFKNSGMCNGQKVVIQFKDIIPNGAMRVWFDYDSFYSIIYCARHSIELAIKHKLGTESENTHNIAKLWKKLQSSDKSIELPHAKSKGIETFIESIHAIDPDGTRFKYTTDTGGKMLRNEFPVINLQKLTKFTELFVKMLIE